ncbi:hypothetical protein PINS_up013244 [Pythium insidiosum]|nr:hypothetical protein PINS_up013244 [Pythium insidiosum]
MSSPQQQEQPQPSDSASVAFQTAETAAAAAPSSSSSPSGRSASLSPNASDERTEPPLSPDARSASFAGHATIGVSTATLWRNKSVSCEGVRSFEAARKQQIDPYQEKDMLYWQFFEKEILRARDENSRLQRFFALRLQADLAYADSLRKIRQVIERPNNPTFPGASSTAGTGASPSTAPPNATGTSGQTTSGAPAPAPLEQLSILSTCVKALNALGEVQQQLSEKIVQFTNVVRRDVVLRPLEEMIGTFEERTTAMLAEGNRLDATLHALQRNVLESFAKYDAIFREMELERQSNVRPETKRDLWLAEIAYCINVQKLRQGRVEYVKGMSALFQQYKTLEVLRVTVLQTAIDTYIRKQKMLFEELSGAMSEPMLATQRIEPERDLITSIRRIPKNFTAAALSSDNTDQKLFGQLRSPISSPLLVRCGFLKHQVSGSIFKSWKDVLCAITQDEFMHLIELKENANRSIVQSSEAMLDAIATNEQTTDVVCASICLTNCRITMVGKSAVPTFEITEMSHASGLFSSMFRIESTRKFTFQCSSQSDLIDWVVAAKRFISSAVSTTTI